MGFWAWLKAAASVFGISLLPVLELKAAIPLGIAMGLPLWQTFVIAVIGSTLPSPFIFLLLRSFIVWCKKTRLGKKLADYIEHNIEKKSGRVRKYSLLGLFVFVAIPLPGTGVWTGSSIATVLDLRLKHALPVIFLGNCVAGILMLCLGIIVL